MNISEHLQKDYWVRRLTPDSPVAYSNRGNIKYREPFIRDSGSSYVYLTQEDLMNEIEPSAHEVMSKYQSMRPIYEPTGEKDDNGREKWAIRGYDHVETVSLGLQKSFALKKASHFASNGFWIANETTNKEAYNNLMSWKDSVGLYTAYLEVVLSCFQTGDGAIYLYQRGDTIEYKVFSRMYGDTLYTDFDEDRNPVRYREYSIKGKRAVDVFTTKYRETWVQLDLEQDKGWLNKFKGWFGRIDGTRSEDGFVRVYREENQVGGDYVQLIYFRVNDIPSGVAEESIKALERALSYVAEEVRASAFKELFIKASKISSLPPMGAHGKVYAVTGDSETVKNADAKVLAPPDASNIATLNINKITENIIRTTMSVFIEPDILKSGSDSSTTIKIMFAPEIQWCQTMWPQFHPAVKEMVEVFKRLVGKVEGNPTEYADLRLSVGLDVWIPQNDAERIKNELDQVYARVKSRSAAMADIGNQHIDDEQKIIEEWMQELELKSRIPAEEAAKIEQKYGTTVSSNSNDGISDDDNPSSPAIDNNSKGKTIAER